jgi:predicted site-specific integrase-resolvase
VPQSRHSSGFTIAEAADRLAVSRETARRYLRAGALEPELGLSPQRVTFASLARARTALLERLVAIDNHPDFEHARDNKPEMLALRLEHANLLQVVAELRARIAEDQEIMERLLASRRPADAALGAALPQSRLIND